MSDARNERLIDECRRLEESCNYTAISFTIWLRWLKGFRLFCEVSPVVFGALATWKIVSQTSVTWAAVFTFFATVIPPAYKASKNDRAIDEYTTASGEFTNLRDRFRQLATIYSQDDFTTFDTQVKPFIERLEKVRAKALTPPDWFFRLSQKKIQKGDYVHDYDLSK